jgi:hypothetical protein
LIFDVCDDRLKVNHFALAKKTNQYKKSNSLKIILEFWSRTNKICL